MPTKCDSEQLVSYLYDDLSGEDAAAFERHLRGCAACREDLAGFQGLRATLKTWAPPQPDLALTIADTRAGAHPGAALHAHAHPHAPAHPHASWRAWWTPAAGLAAAAVFVLAAASALAHVEIRVGSDGFSVRTGWNTNPAPASTVVPSPAPGVDLARFDASVADMQRRLGELEAESHKPVIPSAVRMVSTGTANHMSDTEMLTRVRDLLAQSESRQQRELAIRIGQVVRDVDAQRVADLSRIQQGLGRIDAMTTADAAAHRELANYVITSTRQQK
jgi:anti-sigma factor RsiW